MVQGGLSRHILEVIMVMERPPEVNPPSGRVLGPSPSDPEIGIAVAPEQWTKSRNGALPRVFGARGKYRPKGDLRGGPPGRALEAPGLGVAPLGASFGLPESSVLHIFI